MVRGRHGAGVGEGGGEGVGVGVEGRHGVGGVPNHEG